MTASAWLAFTAVTLVYSLIPGLAFATVLSSAVRFGRRTALLSVAGIAVGDAVFAALAMYSLDLILSMLPVAFKYVEVVGVAYLVWVAVHCMVRRGDDTLPSGSPVDDRRALLAGFLVQLSNPKVMLFITAITPRYVDASTAALPQFMVLGATFVACEALVYCMVAMVAVRLRRTLSKPRAVRLTRLATGVILLAAAAHVARDLFAG